MPHMHVGRWWALALDHHLWPTRIHMMRDDGSVGHSNHHPASSGNRPSNSTDDEEVILDSGAEEHVTGNFALLSRVTAVENGRGIVTASGHFMPALCSGSLIIDGFKVNGRHSLYLRHDWHHFRCLQAG